MKIFELKDSITVNAPIAEVWQFFSSPLNLKTITPEKLNFQFIRGADAGEIYQGQIIEYRVSPMLGIPISWVTEITAVEDQKYFIDEQRFGPYKFWHHQHHFKEVGPEQTEVNDIVHYGLPLDPFSRFMHPLYIKGELARIFAYRAEAIAQKFT